MGSGAVRLQGLLPQAARRVLLPGVPERRAEEGRGPRRSSPTSPTTSRTATKELYKRATSSAPTAGSSRSARGARRGCGTAASTSSARPTRRCSRRSPGRIVAARMGKTSHDRLGQLRAAAPRHDARPRRRCSSTRCTCTSPTSCRAGQAAGVDDQGRVEEAGKPGEVVLLDEPIEAGIVIGHVGKAGPAELSQAADPRRVLLDVGAVHRRAELAVAGRRRHRRRPVLRRAARSTIRSTPIKDGTLSRQELSQFFAGGGGAADPLPRHAPRLGVDGRAELVRRRCAYRRTSSKYKAADIDAARRRPDHARAVVGQRGRAHCRLPSDGVVYHYHPVTFLGWFNQQLLDAAARAARAPSANAADAKEVPQGHHRRLRRQGRHVDAVVGATSPTTRATRSSACQELVQGFDAPECSAVKRRQGPTWRAADPPRVRRDARRRGRRARPARASRTRSSDRRAARRPAATRWIGHCLT